MRNDTESIMEDDMADTGAGMRGAGPSERAPRFDGIRKSLRVFAFER